MSLLTYMTTFTAVVDAGSFTAAADRLGLSKSMVSKHITHLEDRLGARLLNRSTRRLRLTDAGEVFLHHCQRVMTEVKEAELSVADLQGEPRGTLRITAPQSLAIHRLPTILARFQQRYPRLELDVRISSQVINLLEEEIDVAVRLGELADSSLIARRLAPCTFMVCASPGYWKEHGIPVRPADLTAHNCLVYTQSSAWHRWSFVEDGERCTVTVAGNLRSDSTAVLLSAALADQGVMIGPSFLFDEHIAAGRLQPALADYYRPSLGIYAIYPHSKHVSAKIRAFVDHLVEAFAETTP